MDQTQQFSQNFKPTIRPIETCYVPNDLSHLDESFGTKYVFLPGIFRLQIATMYDNVAFSDNGLVCHGSKHHTFH